MPITSAASATTVADGSDGNSEYEALGEGLLVEVTASSGLWLLQAVNANTAIRAPESFVFIFPLCPDPHGLIVH
jgi:hypothetical protein